MLIDREYQYDARFQVSPNILQNSGENLKKINSFLYTNLKTFFL